MKAHRNGAGGERAGEVRHYAEGDLSTHLDLPREASSLEPLFSLLEDGFKGREIDARTSFCMRLTAEELFTNMVRHNVGAGDRITVRLDVSDERIRLELIDHDVEPFDPDTVPPVDVSLPAEERSPGGLGMHLVRAMVDDVSYRYEDRKLSVSVIKKLGE